MNRINILNADTANKIAAGEVVERPSSVVKELVENSLDAGAKNITIEIQNGGESLIKIIDDGSGIHPEDVEKAFNPHATSKIKDTYDIFSINTLGFRGEALPSIASIARVDFKSKIADFDMGKELIISGGEKESLTDCSMNRGTQIEVRDLFFNVPARKKFLKSVSKEGSLINDIITRIALANPDISFKLFNNHKKVIHTFGNNNIKDTLRTIYGKSITDNIIYFEDSSDLVTIHGYIGKEDIARGSRNNQSIFVNKRYIKNKSLAVAVEQAFKSFSTVNKFPFFVLFVEIYPEYVDVNIHPTKAEIKFNDERMVFKKIFSAVHNSLKNDIFESFAIEEDIKSEETVQPSFEEISFKIKEEEEKVKLASNAAKEILNNGGVLKADNSFINSPLFKEDKKDFVLKDSYVIDNSIDIPVDLRHNFNNNKDACNNNEKSSFEMTSNNNIVESHVIQEESSSSELSKNAGNSVLDQDLQKDLDTIDYNEKVKYKEKIAKFPPISIIGQYNKT
ncbi:MAG: DNA mismatch repair endonuclease MutL, partial [Clostridium perfringens]|nr:DNA mismatch repair endonuclease MutL [Clostridium perfringens]